MKKTFSNEVKLKALSALKSGAKIRDVAAHYGCSISAINTWKKNKSLKVKEEVEEVEEVDKKENALTLIDQFAIEFSYLKNLKDEFESVRNQMEEQRKVVEKIRHELELVCGV